MYSQEQLIQICDEITERQEEFLDKLEIGLQRMGKYYKGACQIHGGDNPSALVVRENGKWSCFTHECHKKYYSTPLGLIRGVLTARAGKEVPFGDVLAWAETFIGHKLTAKDVKKKWYNRIGLYFPMPKKYLIHCICLGKTFLKGLVSQRNILSKGDGQKKY